MEPIVELRHITKRFPGIVANNDVSITINKGEVYALLGENGAGKSTLMSMLFGMYHPDEGEILVRGKKVELSSANDAAALGIGMVHQHFKLIHNYTIAENIILGAEPLNKAAGIIPVVAIKDAEKRIYELSRSFGLEVDPKLRIDEVNVSTQQRVEILKMLYRDAEILIFDEPTAVLTPQEIEFLLETITGLQKRGKTIILITHKLEEIKKIAGRCAILRQGKLITTLDVKSTSTQEMANLMVGREVSFTRQKKAPSFGETVLAVENLTVRNEDKFAVVNNVSLKVRRGEIFAIAGVSGNGQIELADAIAGLARASAGKITLKGKDITTMRIRERTEFGIAYIPEDRQRYGVVLDFSLEENLASKTYYKPPLARHSVLQGGQIRDIAEKLITRFDIRSGQGARTITRSMSGGNQQKAIVGREISLDTDLLIFVQPTRGMDIGAIENIHDEIIARRDAGKAILLISLELDEVLSLADTIGVIFKGELRKTAPAAELSAGVVGEYMMGVRE